MSIKSSSRGRLRSGLGAAIASIAIAVSANVAAQSYPAKPIRMIIGFAAGGTTDIIGRVVGEKMGAALGQPIIIENRSGASGVIAVDAILKADPDGYTFGPVISSTFISGLLNGRDWSAEPAPTPIGLSFRQGFYMAINPNVAEFRNVKTPADLVQVIRANPGKINFGSIGVGSLGHLTGELMKSMGGLKWEHVPYRGMAPAIQELVAGQVPLVMLGVNADDPQKFPGKLSIIAVSSAKRIAMTPNVPSMSEAGFPSLDVTTWGAFYGPPALPAAVADRLATEYRKAFQHPETQERLKAYVLEYLGPADLGALTRQTIQVWGKTIKDNNLKPQ